MDQAPDNLAARFRNGDASALSELFQREGQRAFALAFRILGETQAAEDAVQEAFAQLWERGPTLGLEGRVESLLMTMVHRRAIDQWRRLDRRATLPDAELLQHVDERASDLIDTVVESLSLAGLRAELQMALAALPPEQRAVIDLVYGEQCSLREIAERECVPLGTVKSRLRLAMSRLTATLGSRAL